jgi:hypothetical protein
MWLLDARIGISFESLKKQFIPGRIRRFAASASVGRRSLVSCSRNTRYFGDRTLELPPPAACIDCPYPAELPDCSFNGRPDDQNTVGGGQASCSLVEYEEKRDWDAPWILQQIGAVISHRDSSQCHFQSQAGNFVGGELVGTHGDIGSLGERQASFGIRPSEKILKSLLGKRRFLWIGLGAHESVIVRTERRSAGAWIQGAGSASQAYQHDKKEGPFHRAEFQVLQAARSRTHHRGLAGVPETKSEAAGWQAIKSRFSPQNAFRRKAP